MLTMKPGGWETAKSYRDLIKDKDEARSLEQKGRTFKDLATIDAQLGELGQQDEAQPQNIDVEIAADLHLRLAQVHPFIDGNGRVCRLAMNLHLMQCGYPLTIIRAANVQRADYYHALAAADASGDSTPFRAFVAARVLESLQRYEEVLG